MKCANYIFLLLVLLTAVAVIQAATIADCTSKDNEQATTPTNADRVDDKKHQLAVVALAVNSEYPSVEAKNRTQRNLHPKDCEEALSHANNKSGVYTLQAADACFAPFKAYCVKSSRQGTGWRVIQRRKDGSENFFRKWQDYKNGFGNLTGEFWIGLEKLYKMTNAEKHELWIKLKDFGNKVFFARYDEFKIGNETEKYALTVLGNYTGTAGDYLRVHQGDKFSTIDNDNDAIKGNCAKFYKSAWWFKNCHASNLNGEYLSENTIEKHKGRGVVWGGRVYKGVYSMKYVQMAVRPVKIRQTTK